MIGKKKRRRQTTMHEFVFKQSIPASAWRELNQGVTMHTDMFDGRTKADKKAEATRAIRGRAMELALGLPHSLPIRTVKDIVADAAVIERYLTNGAAPKPKKTKAK